MGVPVVTLEGAWHVARVGASILSTAGLADWIAGSPEAYIETAVAAAGDWSQLQELRRSLRPRVASSPLADAEGFTRSLERLYRRMWRRGV